jgi:N utilization substance protein A
VSGVNPKGACIGPMGARVRNVVAELHGEKIDIVDWSDDPAAFIAQALSPAEVISVEVVDATARAARVIVPDYQLSLAIGREGQNARLAARLTGWRIDIRSDAAGDAPGGAPGGATGAASGGSGAPARPAGAPLRGSGPRPRPTTSAPRVAR